jgi:hypothetical protein
VDQDRSTRVPPDPRHDRRVVTLLIRLSFVICTIMYFRVRIDLTAGRPTSSVYSKPDRHHERKKIASAALLPIATLRGLALHREHVASIPRYTSTAFSRGHSARLVCTFIFVTPRDPSTTATGSAGRGRVVLTRTRRGCEKGRQDSMFAVCDAFYRHISNMILIVGCFHATARPTQKDGQDTAVDG